MTEASKIRLLVFTPTLQCGGAEKFVSVFCNHINQEHFSVCLAVLDNSRPFYLINNSHVELFDLHQGKVRYSLFRMRRLVKAFQPDIVFSTANHLNLYFSIFRKWFPAQIKFVARESSIVSINSQRSRMPALYNRLIKTFYRRFDLIVCQSNYMQQDLVRYYNIPVNKTSVVCNAVETEQPLRHTGGRFPGHIYKFITVSRLSEEKGIERLIHAVGLLSVPCRFYIVGEGDKKENIQQLIAGLHLENSIFLTGQKQHPFEGMEDADLYLSGSYYEGLPNALLEAQALGIPAVAFNSPGGIAEIIRDGENGMLVDDNDLIGFATTIKRALEYDFNRNLIIENAQKRYSVKEMMGRLEELFLQL